MPDLRSLFHIPPEDYHFLRLFLLHLGSIFAKIATTNPTQEQVARPMIDVLVGWLPLFAGVGHIHLGQKGGASIYIAFGDRDIPLSITVKPWIHPEFDLPTFPVLNMGYRDRSVTSWKGGKTHTLGLVRSLSRWSLHPFESYGVIEAAWEWNDTVRPDANWEQRRRDALKRGAEPPRAVHWLAPAIHKQADLPEDVYEAALRDLG